MRQKMAHAVLPQPLNVGGDAREPIYPIHDAISLDECRAALENLGY